MNEDFNDEKRRFVRVDVEIAVQYSFLCHYRDDPALDKTYEGKTQDLSGGGLLLQGKIPELPWVPELLMNKMKVAVKLDLINQEPIEAITRVAWIETIDEFTLKAEIGLEFGEITNEDKNRITRYVIKRNVPHD